MFKLLGITIFLFISSAFADGHNNYIYKIKEFEVPLDHFNFEDNRTFTIRYLWNDSYVNREDAPIFFYTGNEGDIELFAQNTGFVWEYAAEAHAYVVFAEHRYYGKSLPFGNASFEHGNFGFLNVEQTLEDYALLLQHIWETKHVRGPVIAYGGSYGGMLAAWFRMKYPSAVQGALAASAPVWQFNGLTKCDIYSKIVTSVFSTVLSENCSLNIRNSWAALKSMFGTDEGKKQLNGIFKFCTPLGKQEDLDDFMDYLEDVYGNLAMANYPYPNDFLAPLPAWPVRAFCQYLDKIYTVNSELIQAMQRALSVYSNYTGSSKCLDYKSAYEPSMGIDAWAVQTCSQMVMPMCSYLNETMIRDKPWDFKEYSDKCYNKYKIRPKLNEITMRYGDKKLDASNIIFSNGLLDPWSGGGVLQAGYADIHVIIIPEGAHHIDLRAANKDDPSSVQQARKQEKDIIAQWIKEFYDN